MNIATAFCNIKRTFQLFSRTHQKIPSVHLKYPVTPNRSGVKFFWKRAGDEPPKSAKEHEDRLKAFVEAKNFAAVKESYENGLYPRNEECLRQYIKALVHLKLWDNVLLNNFFRNPYNAGIVNPSTATSIPTGEQTATQSSSTNQEQPNSTPIPPPVVPNFQMAHNYQFPFGGGADRGPLEVKIQRTWMDNFLSFGVPLLTTGVIVLVLLSLNDDKKSVGFPIANAHTIAVDVKERFDDVKGIDEVRSQLEEIVNYLKNPQKYISMGAKLPKGILLTGEPGTGKTLLSRSIAGEAGVPFYYCSGSAFDELFVGVGPKRVRALFEDARKNTPCIIFIDEIDAMGTARRYSFSSSNAKESTLNQLLTEMDGFRQNDAIIVLAATNIPDALDPALVRPGRFDRQIHVPMPDIKARSQILDLYLKKIVKAADVNTDTLARGTPGFSGADLSNLVNQAAIKAATKGLKEVDMKILDEALDETIMGIRHKSLTMQHKEREKTAFHEAGHTILQLFTEGAQPLYKVTIIPRGRSLGVTMGLPETDRVSQSKQEMWAHMVVCMGGKVAEEIIFGDKEVTGGCSNDLKQATSVARNMVTHYGMSDKLGNVFYNTEPRSIGDNSERGASDHTLHLIDDEVIRLTGEAYAHAKDVLKKHDKELRVLANALLEYESLSGEDVKRVIKGLKPLNASTPSSSTTSGSIAVGPVSPLVKRDITDEQD